MKNNRVRFLENIIPHEDLGRQMRFIAGPRQCGKTTLAKAILKRMTSENLYYNWDSKVIRKSYRENPSFFLKDLSTCNTKTPWVCFDEIHKFYKWKNVLKGIFDENEDKLKIMVTGSARLDLFRRSGDSLAGRYFLFHLSPFILSELNQDYSIFEKPERDAMKFLEKRLLQRNINNHSQKNQKQLLTFSGFPEPLFKQSKTFHKIWQRTYSERLIYDDIRDLSKINNLEAVALLLDTLPLSVGNTLSINSIAIDLEVNHASAKNYLKFLELVYAVFLIKPYKKNISRSIKSSPKIYFYDWTKINDLATLFENYVACELKAITHYWADQGFYNVELFYIRTKDSRETDFLICLDKKPWLLIEVKLNSDSIKEQHFNHAKALGNIPVLQLNLESNEIFRPNKNSFVAPAWKFF